VGFRSLLGMPIDNPPDCRTGITLIAGFASTVSWPLTTWLNGSLDWRETLLVWAALNLVLGLPLNLLLPRRERAGRTAHRRDRSIRWTPRREMFLLAFVFAAAWFVTGAMAAQLPRLLELAGASPLHAISAAALVGRHRWRRGSPSSSCCDEAIH